MTVVQLVCSSTPNYPSVARVYCSGAICPGRFLVGGTLILLPQSLLGFEPSRGKIASQQLPINWRHLRNEIHKNSSAILVLYSTKVLLYNLGGLHNILDTEKLGGFENCSKNVWSWYTKLNTSHLFAAWNCHHRKYKMVHEHIHCFCAIYINNWKILHFNQPFIYSIFHYIFNWFCYGVLCLSYVVVHGGSWGPSQ